MRTLWPYVFFPVFILLNKNSRHIETDTFILSDCSKSMRASILRYTSSSMITACVKFWERLGQDNRNLSAFNISVLVVKYMVLQINFECIVSKTTRFCQKFDKMHA